jgi:hypothetical protein
MNTKVMYPFNEKLHTWQITPGKYCYNGFYSIALYSVNSGENGINVTCKI